MKDKRLLPPLLTIIGLIIAVLAQIIFKQTSVLHLVFLFVAFIIFILSLILSIKFWKKK